MQAIQLLHKIVKKSCVGIHAKRLTALFVAIGALARGGKLSVAGMGRSLNSTVNPKHRIKRIDCLVGNEKLHAEREELYAVASQWVIGNAKYPPIIIDWSWLPNVNYCLLRAAIPAKGRSVTIYEEVHPKKKNNNHKVHKDFLKKLKKIIPKGCQPIIITDAGFHSPFFREVERLGWNWVGRIRNLTKFKTIGEDWTFCKKLHSKITGIPKFFSEVTLSKSTPIVCSLFLYKGKKKGRIAKNKFGVRRKSKASKIFAKTNKEPWVLATSLKGGNRIAKKIIKLYKFRMQIEESFRDLKSSRLGLSFEDCQTYKQKRFEILLLIAMLAILAFYLLGIAGEQRDLQYGFQANTIHKRTVLSIFYLGCQIFREVNIKFKESELLEALRVLRASILYWTEV